MALLLKGRPIRRKGRAIRRAICLYSPSCLEEVFSETEKGRKRAGAELDPGPWLAELVVVHDDSYPWFADRALSHRFIFPAELILRVGATVRTDQLGLWAHGPT